MEIQHWNISEENLYWCMKTGKIDTLWIPCRWKDCPLACNGIDEYLKHVDEHCALGCSDKTEMCPWTGCCKDFLSSEPKETFQAHIYRHAFHAKLQAVRTSYLEKNF